MKKLTLYILFILLVCDCKKETTNDRPLKWLDEKIQKMENDIYYAGSTLYRYQWDEDFYYEITIPLSSCAYCDVYDENGDKVDWGNADLNDYLENRTDQLLIWSYPLCI
jgi:hypothetical protein